MLHTSASAPHERPTHSISPAVVRCRARTWRVLDMHGADGTTQWRLAHQAETPRLIASPPDDVTEVQVARRSVSRPAWVRRALAQVRSHAPIWWPATATTLPVAALPWQFVPAMTLLGGRHRRVLLADAVGMGKTIQAGLLLHEIHAREPDAATLVITPAALVPQWAAELRVRVRLEPAVLDAVALRREAACPRAMVDAARAGTCWLMSIDLLRQPDIVALVTRTRWTLLVVDEAHAAAPGTARFDAVSRVAGASVRVLLLTATPAAGGAGAADGLRRIGARSGEAPMPVLRREGSLLSRPHRRSCVLCVDLGGDHAALCTRLDRFVDRARAESGANGLLPALVLRRRASSCPAALRRSLERRLEVLGERPTLEASPALPGLFELDALVGQDTEDDAAMRVVAWSDRAAERAELEQLLGLVRRLPAAGRKLERVARLVRRVREPVVIFTAFLDTLRALRVLLPAEGVVMVHGEQPDALRGHALRSFTRGDAGVLLATDAAAEGLNLHARCRVVVHAEVPSSTRVFEQRTGRLDRYGQARRVHAIVLSSRTREDQQAIERLQARACEDDRWMASVGARRCRRSAVAARRLAMATASDPLDNARHARHDPPAIAACTLAPRRWRRLASKLGVPTAASAVWTATLRIAGGAELSASRVPVLVAVGSSGLPGLSASLWPDRLRAPVARARRLAHRLARWEDDAADAIAADAARHTMPDLFLDSSADEPVRPPRARQDLWVALEAEAVITPRAGTR